jgi:5-hydroxyisourate hydrolase-like protein (transthyretin family)
MMVLKVSASDSKSLIILTQAEKDALLRIADGFDIPAIVYDVTLFEKLRWPVKNSDNPRALLEAAILRLALSEHFMSIQELLSQDGNIKKNTTVTRRTPSASLKQSQTEVESQISNLKSQTPVISGGADIEQIKQNWDKIVEFVKTNANGRIAELLKKAVPLRLNNGTLSLGFDASEEFSMNLCQSNGKQEQIESALSDSVGIKIKTAFETIKKDGKTEQKAKPAGAKTSKKTIDEAARTPAIRTILSGLDANILDVKEGNGQ